MIKYFNSKTGKEVHYGDMITFEESGKLNGGVWKTSTTVPVINATIPDLIEEGVITQKEISEEEIQKHLLDNITTLKKKVGSLEKKVSKLEGIIAKLIAQSDGKQENC